MFCVPEPANGPESKQGQPPRGLLKLLTVLATLAIVVPWASAPAGKASLEPGSGLDVTAAVLGNSGDPEFPRGTRITALTVSVVELSRGAALWASVTGAETIALSQTASSDDGMTAAQDAAALAASALLGEPVDPIVVVASVMAGSPAQRAGLLIGDAITAVTVKGVQTAVTSTEALSSVIGRSGPGSRIRIEVLRDDREMELSLVTDMASRIGVTITNSAPAGLSEFRVLGVTGGSAGLALALAAVDAASPGDLTGGMRIAATGTITFTGKVGPIGAVRQKLASRPAKDADLVFVAATQGNLPDDSRLHKVATLSEAVSVLCGLGATDAVCDVHDKSVP